MIYKVKSYSKNTVGISGFFNNRYSYGLLEGLKSMIQSLKTNARGYRNDENLMTIYLRLGQLRLNVPT